MHHLEQQKAKAREKVTPLIAKLPDSEAIALYRELDTLIETTHQSAIEHVQNIVMDALTEHAANRKHYKGQLMSMIDRAQLAFDDLTTLKADK